MPHTDGKAYYPIVSTLSLNEGAIFELYENQDEVRNKNPRARLYLEPRSLVVFKDEVYSDFLHTILYETDSIVCENSEDKYYVDNWDLIDQSLLKNDWENRDPEDPIRENETEERLLLEKSKARYSLTMRNVPLIK